MAEADEVDKLIEYEDYPEEQYQNQENEAENKPNNIGDSVVTLYTAAFREFLLKPELLKAIGDCGFEHPSTVQHECIPTAILGKDVLCQAKSGMGKTAVFVLSVLHQLDPEPEPLCTLVLCHARELAYQIKAEFDRFKKYLPNVRTHVFFGGIPISKDREALRNNDNAPHIVIGTPGRILALAKENTLSLSHMKHFILDECDKMLESLDMRKDVQDIFRKTPHSKQVMMFSATLSNDIRPVCKRFMHNPLEVYINDGALTLHGLQQYYTSLSEDQKNSKLVQLLDDLEFNQLVIFVRTVKRAAELTKILQDLNFPSICIHSDLPQEERIKRYQRFKNCESRIMVATDVFGRGIDVERVNVVINYDVPENPATYLHRVGRAGRFGTKGLAISFVPSKDDSVLTAIQDKFVVKINTLPDRIDPNTYMS